MEQSDLVDNTNFFHDYVIRFSPRRHVLQLEFFCLRLISPPPLPSKYINARKCNLGFVQIIVDVYHHGGLYSLVPSKIIKLSDVMYFPCVDSELIVAFI